MPYFLIHNSDGDTFIEQVDPQKFLKDLTENYYGDVVRFLGVIPELANTSDWQEDSYLLIKGDVVIPKPKTVVQEYTLE